MSERKRTGEIHVPVLARVEGEGALEIRIKAGRIEALKLRIFEPPRLFEKLLEGRSCQDVIDSVARICGICPVAYQMSAVAAIESILGVTPSPWVEAMRRVMYCGEWLQSHSLHIHLLAAPDFLGYESAPAMARATMLWNMLRLGKRMPLASSSCRVSAGSRSRLLLSRASGPTR